MRLNRTHYCIMKSKVGQIRGSGSMPSVDMSFVDKHKAESYLEEQRKKHPEYTYSLTEFN